MSVHLHFIDCPPALLLVGLVGCESEQLSHADDNKRWGEATTDRNAPLVITRSCTLLGCIEGAEVEFRNGSWQPGSYEIEIKTENGRSRCSVEQRKTTSSKACEGDLVIDSLLPGSFILTSHPKHIRVRVLKNGKKIDERSFSPTYKTIHPNGEGCPGACEISQERLIMERPEGVPTTLPPKCEAPRYSKPPSVR